MQIPTVRAFFRNRWLIIGLALLFAGLTAWIIVTSVGTLRTRQFFDRTVRRLEILDRRRDYGEDFSAELQEASRHARGAGDWQKLLQLSRNVPKNHRWLTMYELARLAAAALPDDGRWRIIGAYAAVRQGLHREARELLLTLDTVGETAQQLYILSHISDSDSDADFDSSMIPREARWRDAPIVAAVDTALRSPSSPTLWAAWEATGVPAFAVNSALHGAAAGDRGSVTRAAAFLRETDHFGAATIYLAAWMNDENWLFRQLRRLPAQEAVGPEMLLIQADAHLRQEQFFQARELYRELQSVHPEISPLVFYNDAILATRLENESPLDILERGLEHHPESRHLSHGIGAALVRAGNHQHALNRLSAVPRPDETLRLLTRITQARVDAERGVPPERLERDLWRYVNDTRDAHRTAAFLAQHLRVRRDTTGLEELRRRYPPDTAGWAATLHLLHHVDRDELAQSENLLPLLVPGDTYNRNWTGRYNQALFALQFLTLAEAGERIRNMQRWLEQEANLPDDTLRYVRGEILVLEAERQRLLGNVPSAREILNQAINLTPDRESLYSYRSLLAPQD